MKNYFERAIQSAIVIWATLTTTILVTTIVFASLNAAHVAESISLITALVILVGMIILSLAVFPIPLLSRNNEHRHLILRTFIKRYRKDTTDWQTKFGNKINQIEQKVNDNQAIIERSREALVYLIVGDRLLNQKNTEEALENYRKAGSLLPKDSQMNALLGRIYSGLGEYDAAIAALEASLPEETVNQAKVQKELGLAYRRRGEALKQDEDYNKAIQYLKQAISLNPNDSDTFAILGGLYRRKREYEQALASYERAWHLNPGSSYALGNLASLSWYVGNLNDAKKYFQYAEAAASGRIKSGQPEEFWDYYDLALAQLASGNLTEAKKTYTEAIKATPGPLQIDGVLNNLYLLEKAPQPLPGLDEIVKMLKDAKAA